MADLFICPVCRAEGKPVFEFQKSNLNRHIATHCQVQTQCPYCVVKIGRPSQLIKHIQNRHPAQVQLGSPFVCTLCPGTSTTSSPKFLTLSLLCAHINKHHREAQFQLPPDVQAELDALRSVPKKRKAPEAAKAAPAPKAPFQPGRAAPRPAVRRVEEYPDNVDPDNEQAEQVTTHDIDNILRQLPEGSEPYIENNWRHIRSFSIVHPDAACHEYNQRLIGNNGERPADYFRRVVHSKQRTAYKVLASAGFLLRHRELEDTYMVWYPSRNNFNIPIPAFTEPAGALSEEEEDDPVAAAEAEEEGRHIEKIVNPEDDTENEPIPMDVDPAHPQYEGFNGPFLVNTFDKLEHFLDNIDSGKILESCHLPDTKWSIEAILNVHFFIYPLTRPLIGCGDCEMPPHLVHNAWVHHFMNDPVSNRRFNDHLCMFRVISYALDNRVDGTVDEDQVMARFTDWYQGTHQPASDNIKRDFKGVNYEDLIEIEEWFKVSFNVYQMTGNNVAQLLRRSPPRKGFTRINVDLYQQTGSGISHFSYIEDIEAYANVWVCKFCTRKFRDRWNMMRHLKKNQCQRGATEMRFPGGVHRETENIMKRLKVLGVKIRSIVKHYYKYRACYDFESLLKTVRTIVEERNRLQKRVVVESEQVLITRPDTDTPADQAVFDRLGLPTETVPAQSKPPKLQYFQIHVPISFSICSNVPDFEAPFTLVNPDPEALVEGFLDRLEAIAEKAFQLMHQEYAPELQNALELEAKAKRAYKLLQANDQPYQTEHKWYNKIKRTVTSFKMWLSQMPIIGFNSAKYDLPLIKEFLYPALVRRAMEKAKPTVLHDHDVRMRRILKINMHHNVGPVEQEENAENIEEDDAQPLTAAERRRMVRRFFDTEAAVGRDNSGDEDSDAEGAPDHDDEEEGNDDPDHDPAFDQENLPPENRELMREPIAAHLPKIIKQGKSMMCMSTGTMKFLDMSKYLAAGTSLDSFQKAFIKDTDLDPTTGEKLDKLPFPYGFLDSVEKLIYPKIPEPAAFHNQLRGGGISEADYAKVVKLYEDKDIQTFQQYLEIYNERDVVPFLMSINRQFELYWTKIGIDMFKESISLPGVTLKYLYRRTPRYLFGLWSKRDKQLHDELRKDLVGGLSMVMNRLVIAGESIIRQILIQNGGDPSKHHLTRSIKGYDFNALYLWALGQAIPCGFHTVWAPGKYNNRLFYRETQAKPKAQEWLEYKAFQLKLRWKRAKAAADPLDALIGNLAPKPDIVTKWTHGQEEKLTKAMHPVDGYCEVTKTVYEYHGCWWHCHDKNECRSGKDYTDNLRSKMNTESCAFATEQKRRSLEAAGYKYKQIWECEWAAMKEKDDKKIHHIVGLLNRKYYNRSTLGYNTMVKAIQDETMFGFVQVDMDTPAALRETHHFQDFPPIVKNVEVGFNDLSPHMQSHAAEFKLLKKPRRTLVASFKAEKQWMLTSMVKYLMDKGVELTKVHKVIQFDKRRPFKWFMDEVTKARSEADLDRSKELLGMLWKLIGNCGYGKTITDVTKHLEVFVVTLDMARELVNDPYLQNLEPIGSYETKIYEATMRKRVQTQNLPEVIGMAVYHHAKLRMLQFNYDFLGEFCDPYKYEWIQTDTDSAYLALAGETIEDIIKPEMRARFELEKDQWFVIDPKDKRTPGLLKEEFAGVRMVCLGSKTYHVVAGDGETKSATKGLQKANNIGFEEFQKVLEEGKVMISAAGKGYNTGFQHNPDGKIATYVIERHALGYLYIKRYVEDDGIQTRPYGHI